MKKQDLSARQARALRGSIRKWEKIADGTGKDEGGYNCPLCQLYAFDNPKGRCAGCPVSAATNQSSCDGTPYYAYKVHSVRGKALDMLDFLKSILDAAHVRRGKEKPYHDLPKL